MPNRILSDEILTSQKINKLSSDAEVFYYRLIVNCDDFGCFFGEPDVLSSKLYPKKKITDQKAQKLRDEIVNVGLAVLYTDGNETYLYVTKWEEHQRLRAKKRKFPEPPIKTVKNDTCQQVAVKCQSNDSIVLSNDSNPPQSAASRARAESNPIRIHTESESEVEGEHAQPPTTIKIDEDFKKVMETCLNAGWPMPCQKDEIAAGDCLALYGLDRTIKAIERSHERGRKSWGYVRGILKDWAQNGIDEGVSGNGGQAGKHIKHSGSDGETIIDKWGNAITI